MRGTYFMWLYVFLVLLNGDVIVGAAAFDSMCVVGVFYAGLLLQFW